VTVKKICFKGCKLYGSLAEWLDSDVPKPTGQSTIKPLIIYCKETDL